MHTHFLSPFLCFEQHWELWQEPRFSKHPWTLVWPPVSDSVLDCPHLRGAGLKNKCVATPNVLLHLQTSFGGSVDDSSSLDGRRKSEVTNTPGENITWPAPSLPATLWYKSEGSLSPWQVIQRRQGAKCRVRSPRTFSSPHSELTPDREWAVLGRLLCSPPPLLSWKIRSARLASQPAAWRTVVFYLVSFLHLHHWALETHPDPPSH